MVSQLVLWYSVAYFASIAVSSTQGQAVKCQGTAKYTLTFKAEWTPASHANFPSGAHFSSLVGCSHNASYVMWIPGGKATAGVKLVAERGRTGTINMEMLTEINLKTAYKQYQGSGIGATGTRTISDIEVTTEYPLVSFITMIAPSPDWFVGVHDWDLCDTTTGKWKDSSKRYLRPYDSGTDSGPNFRSSNDPTSPPEDIHLITNVIAGSLKSDKPIRRFGTFTFEKTFDSNPRIEPSSTVPSVMTQTQTAYQSSAMSMSVNMKSSVALHEPKESSTQQLESATESMPGIPTETLTPTTVPSVMAQTQTAYQSSAMSTSLNMKSSIALHEPKESSTQQLESATKSMPGIPTETLTPTTVPSVMAQTQTAYQSSAMSTSVNMKSSIALHETKESSRQQLESATESMPGIPTETLTPTATITSTASVGTTPTSAACSVDQLGFILLFFTMILANLCF